MTEPRWIQARWFTSQDLAQLQDWRAKNPHWSRYRLSRELARHWNWYTPAGQLRDMAARHLLRKLQERGLLTLPARRSKGGHKPTYLPAPLPWPAQILAQPLKDLQPLSFRVVSAGSAQARLLSATLAHYHYLDWKGPVGSHLAYQVSDSRERLLAVVVFAAAALKVAARDRAIGWSPQQRMERLAHVVQNTRFLILPWVRVPRLASHVLARCTAALRADWRERYRQELVLVETFVERERFTATCYRAANWRHVGATLGRGRNDQHHQRDQPIKDIYLYPLAPHWQDCLCA